MTTFTIACVKLKVTSTYNLKVYQLYNKDVWQWEIPMSLEEEKNLGNKYG
jgi:hypothetical protein